MQQQYLVRNQIGTAALPSQPTLAANDVSLRVGDASGAIATSHPAQRPEVTLRSTAEVFSFLAGPSQFLRPESPVVAPAMTTSSARLPTGAMAGGVPGSSGLQAAIQNQSIGDEATHRAHQK